MREKTRPIQVEVMQSESEVVLEIDETFAIGGHWSDLKSLSDGLAGAIKEAQKWELANMPAKGKLN